MSYFEIRLSGIPKPAGSKRPFIVKKKGGGVRAAVTDACATSREWKNLVTISASQQYQGEPLTGPVCLDVRFLMPRPKGHYRSNGALKPNAPTYHTSKPDRTKLLRAVEDALTGICWVDDSQVVTGEVMKVYSDGTPGCVIRFSSVDGGKRVDNSFDAF